MPIPACSQTSESSPYYFSLQPSRWALRVHGLLAIMAAAALLRFSPVIPFSCAASCDPVSWQLPLWWGTWLWLTVAGYRQLRRVAELRLLLAEDRLSPVTDNNTPGEPLTFGWSLHPWLLQLRGRSLPGGCVLLWPDSASPEALRRLRVQSLKPR